MALGAAEVSNLGAEIAGLDVTIVQAQILAAGYEQMVAGRLVTNYRFDGIGRVLNLPYQTAVNFGAAKAEGTEVSHVVSDIQADPVTMAKYTIDTPVSMEGESWGAGSAVDAITADFGRAYALKVDGLIHAAANAVTDLDIDNGGATTLDMIATAYQTLLTNKVPGPHIMLLHPEHFTDLYASSSTMLTAITAGRQDFTGGPAPTGYLGRISGFEVFVDPNCTGTGATARSVFFGRPGLWWAWKPTAIPMGPQVSAVNGALGIEIGWRYDFRSYVLSATMIGAANVRRQGDSDTPWVGNIYNVP